MILSDVAIKRPVFAWILMFGLIFFGTLSFFRMGINENPDVDFPRIRISYAYEGATPSVIEKDVIEPVESVLVTMEGIRSMNSQAERGSASISLEFEIDRNIDFALQEVQTLLGRAQRQLPDSIDPPVVTKSNAADDPILFLNLTAGNLTQRELMLLFRDRIQDRLSTIEGVAEVRAFGYHEPQLRVDLIAEKLQQYQLTAGDIVDSIQREHKELPAGKLEFGDSEDVLRIMGESTELEEFQNLLIKRRGGSPNYVPIPLKAVANIYEGVENTRRVNRIDGNPALGMAVQKQSGVNAAATADRVIARIDDINKDLPEGVKLGVNFDRTKFIRESVAELVFTLILSAILTSLVCWLFLGSLSATVNVVLAIPTSIIGTFIFINWFGFTLNTFSLLGLALAIGVVVDDAIVMLENIVRYAQLGWDRVNAAFKGAREITFAVIATTLALVSIFVPITFMPGIEGKFFFEFAVTISVAVALSSLEALTLAPMRCSQFLDVKGRTTAFGKKFDATVDWMRSRYKKALAWCLQRRVAVVGGAAAIFALSLMSLKFLPLEFAPAQDTGALFLAFQAPSGKSLEYTSSKIKEFEEVARQHPEVDRTFIAIGGYGQGGQGNRGNGVVILKDLANRKKSQFEVASELRDMAKKIEGINIFIRDRSGSAFAGRRGSPVEFTISGPDPDKQREYYYEMKKAMEESGLIVGVRSDDALVIPEVQIVPDRREARDRGVEISTIADTINATFGGVVAAEYTQGSRRFEIFVQLQDTDRSRREDIQNVLIRNNRGELLPLSEVVDTVSTTGPQNIFREDRVRGLRVDGDLSQGAKLGDAVKVVREASARILPADYYIRFQETPDDKLMDTVMIMLLGLIIAYMVLATQFNSFTDPMIVFLAVPFALTGSLIGLLAGGQTLNIYSVIGIMLTMGIVKKVAILIIEFTNHLRDQGKDLNEALLEACTVRFRPILMTTTATLAAAVPPALALGPGAETRIPLALTVLGGVSISAVLSLLVVPCVYSLMNPKRRAVLEETPERLTVLHSGERRVPAQK